MKNNNCRMCNGKEWMILEMNPMDRAHDHVAPCLMCSPTKNLNEIQDRRNIKLQRDDYGRWFEETVQ